MHELSVIRSVAQAVQEVARENHALRVVRVALEVGELAMLDPEQMRYVWSIVAVEGVLSGSELAIEIVPAEVRCTTCGYCGKLHIQEDPLYHQSLPVFACPECTGPVEITRGTGCTVVDVRVEIEDRGKDSPS